MKKLNRDIMGYGKGQVMLSVMSGIGTSVSAGTGIETQVGKGFTSLSNMMVPMGTIIGGGHALRMVQKGFRVRRHRK